MSSIVLAVALALTAPDSCPRVREIQVVSGPALDTTPRRWRWALRWANRLHVSTRPDVVRRELPLRPGQCFDETRRREAERVLRATPFLADAEVRAVPRVDGDVDLEVRTRDEWSLRVEVAWQGGTGGLRGLQARETNLLGTGQAIGLFWEERQGTRVYGLGYSTPQVFGSRWDLALAAGRTPVGRFAASELRMPFVREDDRWAVRFEGLTSRHDFEFVLPDGPDGALRAVWRPEERQRGRVTAAVRWGRRLRSTLLGAGVSWQRLVYPGAPRAADGQPLPPLPALDTVRSTSLLLLLGQRNLVFVPVRGFDTVNGREDLRLGVEVEAGMGTTVPRLSADPAMVLQGRFFTATRAGPLIAGAQLEAEGERRLDAPPGQPEWSDVLAEAALWGYLKPTANGSTTYVLFVNALGGWHNRTPFQLTLGGHAGLRGEPRLRDPGARRLVLSLEARHHWRHWLSQLLDVGSVAFVDVGRSWAGAPTFATGSPWRISAGTGLRLAFPRGSQQTLRVDVAVPLGPGARRPQLTIGVGQAIGMTLVWGDAQLARSRRHSVWLRDLFTSP